MRCFQMLVYPGDYGIPGSIAPDAPPTFLVVTNDDEYGCDQVSFGLLRKYRDAKRPIEAHFYARGKHAFNMGDRSELLTTRNWPQRMAEWLQDNYVRPVSNAEPPMNADERR